MAKTLEFLFDFGSPNVYLAWKALPPILRRTGASLKVTPILLGGLFKLTDNRSPVEAFAGVKGKLAYENLETQRFVARHGLSAFRMNPHFPVNTLLIQRGLVAAGRAGVAEAYREAVLAAMWEQGLKMDSRREARSRSGAFNFPARNGRPSS
ncbi:DsbA family protein, partial [Phenylobacterium sp.]|uniref:DsbA family protein n=1 Tax=Phenylobacterium sp. TaxID=1871053 RepID=UPI00199CDCAF